MERGETHNSGFLSSFIDFHPPAALVAALRIPPEAQGNDFGN